MVFLVIGFAIIFGLVLISLPTVLAFLINRWLKQKGIKYVGTVLIIIAPLWTAYEIYTAIYPPDNFYFEEYEEVTLREIPASAKIKKKVASYPDFHGDYCSASLIILSKKDYSVLLKELKNDERLSQEENIIGSNEMDYVMSNFKREQIVHSFTRSIENQTDHYLFIGFIDDGHSIIVTVCVN